MRTYGSLRRLQELAHAKGVLISDKKFFTSPEYSREVNGEIRAMLRRYTDTGEFPVSIEWDPQNDNVGYTDAEMAHVNAGSDIFDGLSRWERSIGVHGVAKHELAHRLYTDFASAKEVQGHILKGKLLPEPEVDAPELADILADYKKSFLYWYHTLANSLEDGYIEYRMMEDYPHGNHTGDLMFMRKLQYTTFPTLRDMKSKEKQPEDAFITISNLLLCYAKYGKIRCKQYEYGDPRVQKLLECIPWIDETNNTFESEGHLRAVHNVIALLAKEMYDYLKAKAKTDEEIEKEMKQSLHGNGNGPSQNTKPLAGNGGGEGKKGTSSSSGESSAGQHESEENTDGSEQNDAGTEGDPESATAGEDGVDGKSGMKNPPRLKLPENAEPQNLCDEDGGFMEDTFSPEEVKGIKEETERVAKEMAEKEAAQELEKERISRENKELNVGNVADIHKGVHATLRRQDVVADWQRQTYAELAELVLPLSRRMNRLFLQQIRELAQEERMTGLTFGQRFYAPSILRPDKKYFTSNRLPSNPSMAVGVLVDESGSMTGNRITMARLAAVLMEDFCRNANIPLSVMGHHTDCYGVVLTSYVEFDSYDADDRVRLMAMDAGGANRDGYALAYMEKKLKKQDADIRILFLISDGQPADDNYMGEPAFEDLRNVKLQCERDHILLITAAIGEDKEAIQKIYGDSFLDISDLEQLPKKLIDILKHYIY